MEFNGDWLTIITVILVGLGLLWRFETRISGVESRLGERIAHIEGRLENFADNFVTKADVARIEGRLETFATKADVARLEGYFLNAGKREEAD